MRSKAPLLLMEQMVMLLVFALAAALCLQAFVKSDGLSGDSMTLGPVSVPEGEGAFSAQQAYLDLQKVADELEQQKKSGEDDGQITLSL